MYINGNDTTDKWLRFNSSWDGLGSERLQIRGSDGYTNINGGLYIADYTTIRPIVGDRGSYNHALAPLTITNQTVTGTTLNDSLPVLNLCRQGLGGVAYGARATLCLSRFENSNVWSRTRLDFKLASDTYNDIMSMTLRSDGNYIFYPNPQYINNTNGANLTMNLNVGCYTTGFATAPFISCTVADGWNGIDTITTITAQSGANSGYNNASRMILDGSYATNSANGAYASTIKFDSINSSGWTTDMILLKKNNNNAFLGIYNNNPLQYLHIGNCLVTNSAPVIVFGKNVNGTGFRNAFIGYNDSFYFCIGDYGNTNTSNSFTNQFGILYNAPASSFVIQSSGYCIMQFGYGTSSDERIKTNIKTIENALDKTLLLRGVEYYDFRIEPEKKRIGLIAQEVELIMPEVVRTGDDGLKGIEYQNLVGLLIEAIKEQQKQINELKNILKNNNLY